MDVEKRREKSSTDTVSTRATQCELAGSTCPLKRAQKFGRELPITHALRKVNGISLTVGSSQDDLGCVWFVLLNFNRC
jgi:hypothetical protein